MPADQCSFTHARDFNGQLHKYFSDRLNNPSVFMFLQVEYGPDDSRVLRYFLFALP